MKKSIKLISVILLVIALLLCFASCIPESSTNDSVTQEGPWANAIYTEDATVGDKYTVKVEIEINGHSVTLTVKTDKETLGEALYEKGIINDPSFFDTCNGIKADWNTDKAYWAFYVNGAIAQYGIGDEKASTSSTDTYKLVYTISK